MAQIVEVDEIYVRGTWDNMGRLNSSYQGLDKEFEGHGMVDQKKACPVGQA
jgi:hypothetical protein